MHLKIFFFYEFLQKCFAVHLLPQSVCMDALWMCITSNLFNSCKYDFWGKKFIFNHPTIGWVWFLSWNSKLRNLWPSNYQINSSLVIELFWWVVLNFLYIIYSLDLKMITHFFARISDLSDSYGHRFITVSFIFSDVIYIILSLFSILFLCYCVKTTI
jgi:hypothetical protein